MRSSWKIYSKRWIWKRPALDLNLNGSSTDIWVAAVCSITFVVT
jgi:hypothetical protein